jgi:hypothetical protein
MKNLKLIFLPLACCIALVIVGCKQWCDHCGKGTSRKITYALVNNTNGVLHYKTYYDVPAFSFDTILHPNDTLFLYSEEFIVPGPVREVYVPFYGSIGVQNDGYAYLNYRGAALFIIYDSETILFYKSKHSTCGSVNIVSDKKDEDNRYHYWVIDSSYIAENFCGE